MADLANGLHAPAMVNIHGGGYKNGQYKLDRTNMVNQGVVAITLQAVSKKTDSNYMTFCQKLS